MKKVFSINECFPKLNKQLGEAWISIDWKACQAHVDRLQRSISVAMEYGDYAKVHELRRILYKSKAHNLLCTRRVTQDNQGNCWRGQDKTIVTSPKNGINRRFE